MAVDSVRIELEVARAAVERGVAVRSRFPVTGASMAPALTAGMRVTVETAPAESLLPGELVCCLRPGAPGRLRPAPPGSDKVPGASKFIHRLVRTERDAEGRLLLVTRGDAGSRDDPPVPAENLIGRVVRVEPAPWSFRLRRAAGRARRALRSVFRRRGRSRQDPSATAAEE